MKLSPDLIKTEHPLLLFDGVCNLCEKSVQFVIQRDPAKKFRFASLQSALGQKILRAMNLPITELHTMILVEKDRVYLKSSAALHVAKKLHGVWPFLFIFILVPRFIRDRIYSWIVRHRYQWFGKKEQCLVPTPENRDRFLD